MSPDGLLDTNFDLGTIEERMKFFSDSLKHQWKRIRDFCVYRVLHADDPPHRLALGIGIGMFVTFLPLIGFQMMLSFFLAWLFRANKLVGVPLVWISNPLTIVPIYYPCYWLGCRLLNESDNWEHIRTRWTALTDTQPASWGSTLLFGWESLLDLAGPLGLGCLIVAMVMGVISYYASLILIRNYRFKRWGQLMPPQLTPQEASEVKAVATGEKKSASGENAA